jgi:RNA polymerase sigma-70 factor (ECF subfamily)
MSQNCEPDRGFPSTHWSAIERAGREFGQANRPQLSEMLRRYLPALRAHLLMRRSVDRDQVDDVVQGFISGKVLESDLIGSADRTKGKFRSLLLTALDRYVISVRRHEQSQKRGANRTAALESEDEQLLGGPTASADAFDVEWAREVLRETLNRMQAQCQAEGRPDVWGVFESRVLKPALEGSEPPSYQQIVQQWSYRAPTQMWNAVRTGKQIFARLLRSVIAEYTDSDEQVETELMDLREICARLPQGDAPDAYP